jgi:hypothetical protein
MSSNTRHVFGHGSRLVTVISGPVVSGKTTLADGLGKRMGAQVVRTRPILENQYYVNPSRSAREHLQHLGETLDNETGGRWVAEATAAAVKNTSPRRPVIVDAVRRDIQITYLRSLLTARILHIHTTAADRVLERRYEERRSLDTSRRLARSLSLAYTVPRLRGVSVMPSRRSHGRLGVTSIPRLSNGRVRLRSRQAYR